MVLTSAEVFPITKGIMRAVRILSAGQLEVAEVPGPKPVYGEVIVTLRAAALNHRDVWIKRGQYAGVQFPLIPGSDGAGIVTAIGDGVDSSWLGREVVINPSLDWGPSLVAQSERFSILGLPRSGTLAEQVSIPAQQLALKPAKLSFAEAAALPLSGLTAWRAVFTRARLAAGERILITGIGGGVALYALAFASAAGADAWVTSSSVSKIARATKFGASGGFNYTLNGWVAEASKAVPSLFDVIVDGAGGAGFAALLDLCAPGARIVNYGATRGNPPELPLRKLFWRQASLLGTTMGSTGEFGEMLRFVAEHRIKPVISEEFSLEQAEKAFGLMERGDQYGKIIVRIS